MIGFFHVSCSSVLSRTGSCNRSSLPRENRERHWRCRMPYHRCRLRWYGTGLENFAFVGAYEGLPCQWCCYKKNSRICICPTIRSRPATALISRLAQQHHVGSIQTGRQTDRQIDRQPARTLPLRHGRTCIHPATQLSDSTRSNSPPPRGHPPPSSPSSASAPAPAAGPTQHRLSLSPCNHANDHDRDHDGANPICQPHRAATVM